jgi:hypothetical protein
MRRAGLFTGVDMLARRPGEAVAEARPRKVSRILEPRPFRLHEASGAMTHQTGSRPEWIILEGVVPVVPDRDYRVLSSGYQYLLGVRTSKVEPAGRALHFVEFTLRFL